MDTWYGATIASNCQSQGFNILSHNASDCWASNAHE